MEYTNMTHDDLTAEQVRLEEEASAAGIRRFNRKVERAQEAGAESDTYYGTRLVSRFVGPLADAIDAWVKEASTGMAGRRNIAAKKLVDMDVRVAAYLALKGVINGLIRGSKLTATASTIGSMVEVEQRMVAFRKLDRNYHDAVVKRAEGRRYVTQRTMAMTKSAKVVTDQEWNASERVHVGTRLIELVIEHTGLVEVNTYKQGKRFVQTLVASPTAVDWVNRANETMGALSPVYEPMVVPPKAWSTPFDGGYLTSEIPAYRLIKTRESDYIKSLEGVEMPIVYGSINALQNTAWAINRDIYGVMMAFFEMGQEVAGIPSEEGKPLPIKPLDIAENDAARLKYRIEAGRVHRANIGARGSRLAVGLSLATAGKFSKYDRIYFPYQLDFRGRIYAVPHLNPQGSDTVKALIHFADGKPLGEEGMKWLAVHGANLAGNDKVPFADRVRWVLDNEEEIVACANDPFSNHGWRSEIGGQKIDKPWQFLAFAMEWRGVCEQGEDYVSRLPIALDGSCSGLQHFSAMLRDPIGGAAVNLVPQDKPADVYAAIAARVNERLKVDAVEGTDDTEEVRNGDQSVRVRLGTRTLATMWLKFGVNRKTCKRPTMTLSYGSSQYGFAEQLREDILLPAMEAATNLTGEIDKDRFPFGEDGHFGASIYLASLIYEACTKVLVAATEAMSWLQQVAKIAAKDNKPLRWTTPVGLPVVVAYRDKKPYEIRTSFLGKTRYATAYSEMKELDKRKQAQGISPNLVHSCDAAHMMLTVLRAEQKGITNFAMIHDSFGTLAADTPTLFDTIRESMVEMYDVCDVLEQFLEEVKGQMPEDTEFPPVPAKGSLDLAGVLASPFAFA
jgi:DNA-directed RNA polymerase, mitochondrial